MDKKITIVTHDSHFHADEIFAVATLTIALGEENIIVVRSRDAAIIEKGDYVVDNGGIYNESQNKFDHHQTGGAGSRENGVPYASFGLVWKKFGEKVSGSRIVADMLDARLVQPIDALDCGVQYWESKIPGLGIYEIGEFIETLYPTWKEDSSDPEVYRIFMQGVLYAKHLLQREIVKAQSVEEARGLVEEVYEKTADKRLIIFERHYPWGDVLRSHEEPLFAISPRENGTWTLHTVRKEKGLYGTRKDLPQSWGGKRDEELEKITGVSGALFCHPKLFLAGAKTKEAILKMAEIALNS